MRRLVTEEAWMADAACADVPVEVFFPGPGRNLAAEAKQVCEDCPVRRDCLQYALDNRFEYGVWGGLNERERHRFRNRRILRSAG